MVQIKHRLRTIASHLTLLRQHLERKQHWLGWGWCGGTGRGLLVELGVGVGGVSVTCGQHLHPHLILGLAALIRGFKRWSWIKERSSVIGVGVSGLKVTHWPTWGLAMWPLVSQMASLALQGAHFCAHPGTRSHGPVTRGGRHCTSQCLILK